MEKMWDKIVKLLFKMNYKDRDLSLIVMSCCQTESRANKMIQYLERNMNVDLDRNKIIEEATKIRDEN